MTQRLLAVLDVLSHKCKSRCYLEKKIRTEEHARTGHVFLLRWLFRQKDKRHWQRIVAAIVDLALCVDLTPPAPKRRTLRRPQYAVHLAF